MALVADHPYKRRRPTVTQPRYVYQPHTPKAKIFLDADYDSDCDDAGDVAVLMALRALGECDVIGAVSTSANAKSAPALLGHFDYWGAGDIPVGANTAASGNATSPGTWVQQNATDYAVVGKTDASDFESYLTTYRRELAAAPDNSVTISMCGTASSFLGLLNSSADGFSALNGVGLVAQKCRAVILSAGWAPSGPPAASGDIELNATTRGEFNDIWTLCPVPFTFAFSHIFVSVKSGSICPTLSAGNPLRTAWSRFHGSESASNVRVASQLSHLVAVRGFHGYVETIGQGQAAVDEGDGSMAWTLGAGNNYYVRSLLWRSEWLTLLNDLMAMEPA